MKKRLICTLSFCALAAAGRAAYAAPGEAGGEFLRILQSPRAVAMGESGAGAYGDLLGALSLNPAALGRNAYKEAAFTYNSWLEGITSQQAAYSQPLGRGVAAVSVLALSVPSIDGYNNAGLPAGSVEAGDMAGGVSYAARLAGPYKDKLSGLFGGGTLKYASRKLGDASASAPLLDAGLLWISRSPDATVALGLSAQSLGGGFKFDSVTDPAPSVYRLGASYIILAAGDPITFSADLKKPSDSDQVLCVGAEYQVWRTISVRGGYASGEDLGDGLRMGGGVTFKLLQLDYSLSPYGKFGQVHRFALSYKFDRRVKNTEHLTFEQEESRVKTGRARALLNERRYYEAVLELNSALALDPGNREAIELMRRAKALLEESR